jgi:hypothetical protein
MLDKVRLAGAGQRCGESVRPVAPHALRFLFPRLWPEAEADAANKPVKIPQVGVSGSVHAGRPAGPYHWQTMPHPAVKPAAKPATQRRQPAA